MNSMKAVALSIPLYGYHVEVVVTKNIAKARNARKDEIGGEYVGDAEALHSYNEEAYKSWLFLPPTVTPGMLAHECHHCVCRMFSMIGAKKVDEEVHAYTLEWLVDEVSRIVKAHDK